jgi:hypothetical protein
MELTVYAVQTTTGAISQHDAGKRQGDLVHISAFSLIHRREEGTSAYLQDVA